MSKQASPHRLVMIEDNPADTLLFRHALDEVGEPYVLEVLSDGESALQYVREHCARKEADPCLIVLDLHLPRCDGATVLRAIRSESELSRVSVAVLTTTASPMERAEVERIGVEAYWTKPMGWAETLELARELIRLCKQSPKRAAAQLA